MKAKTIKSPYRHVIRALPIFFIIMLSIFNIPTFAQSYEEISDIKYTRFYLTQHSHQVFYYNNCVYEAFAWYRAVGSTDTIRIIVAELDNRTLSFKRLTYDYTVNFNTGFSSSYAWVGTTIITTYQNKLIVLGVREQYYYYRLIAEAVIIDLNTNNYITGFTSTQLGSLSNTLENGYNYYIIGYGVSNFFMYLANMKYSGSSSNFAIMVGKVDVSTGQITTYTELRTRGTTEYMKYGFMCLDGSTLYAFGIGIPNYIGLWRIDTGTFTLTDYSYSNNKKVPLVQTFSLSSTYPEHIVPIHVEYVSKTSGQKDAYFRIHENIYLGLDSDGNKQYFSKYSLFHVNIGADTEETKGYYVLSDDYRSVGEWRGYALKYHVWQKPSFMEDLFVLGYDTINMQYQLVLNQPVPLFGKTTLTYYTTCFQIHFPSDTSIKIRYASVPMPTYTISLPTSTSTTLTQTYYQSPTPLTEDTGTAFLLNVIIPFSIILIPVSIFYYLMGTLGALIGLGIGVGLLQISGFAPFSLIVLVVLLSAVALWRGINTKRDNET